VKIDYYKNLSLGDLENEIWKDIIGYEGFYKTSNLGRIKSLPKQRGFSNEIKSIIRKQNHDKVGYLVCGICKEGIEKKFKVHRLIAIHFIDNPDNKTDVNHINGIKDDNRIVNLEWVSKLENQIHSWEKLNRVSSHKGKFGKNNHLSKKVNQYTLNGELIKKWDSMADVERELKISHSHISKVCIGTYKQYMGFKWKFELK
jgi:hypothetical protein